MVLAKTDRDPFATFSCSIPVAIASDYADVVEYVKYSFPRVVISFLNTLDSENHINSAALRIPEYAYPVLSAGFRNMFETIPNPTSNNTVCVIPVASGSIFINLYSDSSHEINIDDDEFDVTATIYYSDDTGNETIRIANAADFISFIVSL